MSGPAARGLYLPTAPASTFAVFHESAGEPRGLPVLICPPFGWEEFCSYRSRRAWAQTLAAAGHPALRIDFPATGDSGGAPEDPARIEAWTAAVTEAVAWLRAATGCERVATIGIGLGGLIACRAVAQGAAIDDLVLWAVPARGRTLLRELRTFARLNATEVDASDAIARPAMPEPPPLADGSLEVGGFLLDAETATALESLDLTALALPGPSPQRVLMLERDGIAVDRRLREHLEGSGAEVTVAPGPGYGTMMAHPQQARPPTAEFATVSEWLAQAPSPARSAAASAGDVASVELVHRGQRIREAPLSIEQPHGSLSGVVAEPLDAPAAPFSAILLNAGALRRIGPGRLWVELARDWAARGVATLRIDLEGLGDSDGDSTAYADTGALYTLDLVDQVIAAMDELEGRGRGGRFLLAGLCAGAFWSFHAALRDPRVLSTFLLNPRALIWDESLDRERDARKIGGVMSGSSWRQVLRGRVSAARMRVILGAALVAPFRARAAAVVRRNRRRELDQALVRLRDAGTRLLLVFGGDEPLHEELEREGRLSQLDQWPNMQLELLPGNDHSFRPIRSQHYVHAVLEHALDRELAGPPDAASRPRRNLGVVAEGARSASPASAQGDLNTEFWSATDLVGSYAGDQLRPVEALLFDRHREALAGRVLEIGSGGGRVTRHLAMLADDVHGIDISPAMVAHTSRAYPEATIILRDLRDLSVYQDASFDALVAPFNVIDVLDHDDRERALDGFSRVVVGGGLVIISSHNRGAMASVRGPGGQLLAHLRERRFRSVAAGIVRFPQRFTNHRRLQRLERDERDYAIVNDSAHHYALLHYYISRDDQERQLEAHGFELIESLDLEGQPVASGEQAPSSSELHYVARRV